LPFLFSKLKNFLVLVLPAVFISCPNPLQRLIQNLVAFSPRVGAVILRSERPRAQCTYFLLSLFFLSLSFLGLPSV
jgi:hypothetical protein